MDQRNLLSYQEKGESVVGKPHDVVVDEDYQQGKSFKVED